MTSNTRMLVHAFAILSAAMLCSGPSQAGSAPMRETAEPQHVAQIVVVAGKSKLVELSAGYSTVMIADPKVADVMPLNSRSVYIVAKQVGVTTLSVYGANKRLVYAADIVVGADIDGLKGQLHAVLPEEARIAVSAANQSIVLSGTVSNPVALHQAEQLAQTYSPGKVVNMMTVQGTQEVMLSVRFVEMQRSTAKDLSLNVKQTPTTTSPQVTVLTGDSLVNAAATAANSFGGASLLWGVGGGNMSVMFDALESKGLVKTLAEPTLVTTSGQTANFLAGGEFPIPVQQSTGTANTPTITVEFKQFGISLAFTPTLLKDGLISMVVDPEVSGIDQTNSYRQGSITIPGIKARRAHTTVELRDGESFTIAGLLSDNYESTLRSLPFIGDIPVLGALFRSTSYQKDQTELVIVVTPHLVVPHKGPVATPADHFVPPSDLELFLFGAQKGKAENISPEDRALITADPAKGGIEGTYGHVLY
jgi:pilus assembly protein CpaC